jgi:hypothetical protein
MPLTNLPKLGLAAFAATSLASAASEMQSTPPLPSLPAVHASFKPGEPWPCADGQHINAHGGGFLYEDGIYYWVGESRAERASLGVALYASRDLYNWKSLGLILPPVTIEGHPLEEGCVMERPKLLRHPRTGQYILWFHHELKGQGYKAALIGVATSDSIAGPYTYQRSFQPNGHDSRDMTVYQASDGSAYLVYASEVNLVLRAAQLTDDYLGVTERDELLFRRHREAPAIFEYRNRFYMITSACTGWKPNRSELHVADSIFGPWEHLGDPFRGKGSETSFDSQSTFVLPVAGRENAFIYVGNRWRPGQLSTSPHVWLPIELPAGGQPAIRWRGEWDLSWFDLPW